MSAAPSDPQDELAKILDVIDEALDIGEGVSMDYYLKSNGFKTSMAEIKAALSQLMARQRIDELEKAGARAVEKLGNEFGLKVLEINDKRHQELKGQIDG